MLTGWQSQDGSTSLFHVKRLIDLCTKNDDIVHQRDMATCYMKLDPPRLDTANLWILESTVDDSNCTTQLQGQLSHMAGLDLIIFDW